MSEADEREKSDWYLIENQAAGFVDDVKAVNCSHRKTLLLNLLTWKQNEGEEEE